VAPSWFATWRDRVALRWQRGRAAVAIAPRMGAQCARDRVAMGALTGWIAGDGVGWPTGVGPAVGALVGLLLAAWRVSAAPGAPPFSAPAWSRLSPHRHRRVTVRRLERGDAAAAIETVDEEMARWNGWPHALAAQIRVVLSHPLVALESGYLAVCEEDRLIGIVSLGRVDGEPDVASLGCWLGPAGRGRGLGAEMVAAAGQVAWSLGFRSVVVGTSVENVAMRRSIERAGALHEAHRPHALPNGEEVDSTWFRLRRPLGWRPGGSLEVGG
jgi:RimJ/RimL family protein N-acetyltransferase